MRKEAAYPQGVRVTFRKLLRNRIDALANPDLDVLSDTVAAPFHDADTAASALERALGRHVAAHVPPAPKVVISTSWGGASDGVLDLSEEAIAALRKQGLGNPSGIARDDPRLVAVTEARGSLAGAPQPLLIDAARVRLAVAGIPYGVTWLVHEIDGVEWVSERDSRWEPGWRDRRHRRDAAATICVGAGNPMRRSAR